MNKITKDGIIEKTNIFVYQILEWLAAGKSQETIISENPDISKEDISKALYYAADKLKPIEKLFIYVDGASSGNPGPAGIGIVIYNKNKHLIDKISEFIGNATNNVAEYMAVIKALEYSLSKNTNQVTIFSDSELVVKQLNGEYLIKNKTLKTLVFKVAKLIDKFKNVKIIYVPREKNELADKLADQSIKKQKRGEVA
ncbi:MAG: reverse transcriptase-like protein [bacterium]